MESVDRHVGQLMTEDLLQEFPVPLLQMGRQSNPTLDRPTVPQGASEAAAELHGHRLGQPWKTPKLRPLPSLGAEGIRKSLHAGPLWPTILSQTPLRPPALILTVLPFAPLPAPGFRAGQPRAEHRTDQNSGGTDRHEGCGRSFGQGVEGEDQDPRYQGGGYRSTAHGSARRLVGTFAEIWLIWTSARPNIVSTFRLVSRAPKTSLDTWCPQVTRSPLL